MNFAILNPKGIIALQERSLMITAVLLMLIIVIPVFIATAYIARKYRAGNTKAKYNPNGSYSLITELMKWTAPAVIIVILGTITWKATHKLDPLKPIDSAVAPITIQVVALQWKWLFIYPEQNIATVNFIQFPQNTPINFELTADAPMNSFWIPQLGGQMYAMPGMSSHLRLMASETGEYAGSAAEISGRGFSGMKFVAKSTTLTDFNNWVKTVRQAPRSLSLSEYNKLASPSENTPPAEYSTAQKNLYDTVMMKFMMPTQGVE